MITQISLNHFVWRAKQAVHQCDAPCIRMSRYYDTYFVSNDFICQPDFKCVQFFVFLFLLLFIFIICIDDMLKYND